MSYEVGYGRPPKASRWKKGQSGNPRGRNKGSGDVMADLMVEMAEIITITENGKTRRITKQRALMKKLMQTAIQGDTKSANILIRLSAQLIRSHAENGNASEMAASDREAVEAYLEEQVKLRLAAAQARK